MLSLSTINQSLPGSFSILSLLAHNLWGTDLYKQFLLEAIVDSGGCNLILCLLGNFSDAFAVLRYKLSPSRLVRTTSEGKLQCSVSRIQSVVIRILDALYGDFVCPANIHPIQLIWKWPYLVSWLSYVTNQNYWKVTLLNGNFFLNLRLILPRLLLKHSFVGLPQ